MDFIYEAREYDSYSHGNVTFSFHRTFDGARKACEKRFPALVGQEWCKEDYQGAEESWRVIDGHDPKQGEYLPAQMLEDYEIVKTEVEE